MDTNDNSMYNISLLVFKKQCQDVCISCMGAAEQFCGLITTYVLLSLRFAL